MSLGASRRVRTKNRAIGVRGQIAREDRRQMGLGASRRVRTKNRAIGVRGQIDREDR
ncbi:MAG: hypothetical protein LBD06_08445 [Candidatus Accumulibacter sp.]|nr:hypothetical protein [Accumulibacter sp.]